MALAALSRSDLRGLASGALGLACRHGGGLLRTRAGSSHADSAAGSSRHGSSSSKSSNSNDSGSASADAEDAAPSSGRACERPEAARADVSSDRLAALESEVLALRQALSALQHHNTQQQQQPKQQQQQQQQQQPQPHGRDEQADERGAAAKAAAAAAAGDGAGATEAMAEGISKLHPRITRLVQSGYLESLHHLRQRLMVDEWEGGGRQRAARRGVADFEAALAAGEHGEAAAGVGGDGGHGAGAAAGGAGSGGGGDGGGGEAGGEGGGSEQPGTGGTRAGGSGGSGRPAMPLTWEQLTRLYEAPDPARELEAVIADPRLRSAARATLQRVLDERHEKVHDAATALAKELADSVARSPGDLLGGLIKILPLPGFLKPK
ncbi:hypothetical protein HYH02_011544 [Chlamydomonas schloesseri]|uniref:Uncharacterized protein n=1 Tax=Chlamydomonas schloesseri TaxID=2026947 RepID=A0A835TA73_9CHLO|nr:hypothetical protein HYH02_011544 [Chlamydomonas schloesseri]|eukprot:KAG2436609.1 hypothetical protein HYH02_011544 [Chlamydomonas schloesseri]